MRPPPAVTASLACVLAAAALHAAPAVSDDHPTGHPPAPATQSAGQVSDASAGCVTCHSATDEASMHSDPGVRLGCTDCHGGDATVALPPGTSHDAPVYSATQDAAHVAATELPDTAGANPVRSYTALNRESQAYIRFINPSDYRVVRAACGACHLPTIQAAERSIMATGAMLWGGGAYNNGVLPFKSYLLGEAYTPDGDAAAVPSLVDAEPELADQGILDQVLPLPAWQTVPAADNFRAFEPGRTGGADSLFPETAVPAGTDTRPPGEPDLRVSSRGPGTGLRVAGPVLNIHKTRLNDPNMWFLGTNDQPGDYRSSGCAACHVVYANDRDPRHSGPWAAAGRDGQSRTQDPTIDPEASGHPIEHAFTRAIPTSQCMVCHMHQPNVFVNSFLGYTMWDYESDAPHMWPETQQYPSAEERRDILERNPEGAAVRGAWADYDFMRTVADRNDQLSDTQFADYHGHGWNFRAIFKRDRHGNLLDEGGTVVDDDDPAKFDKAVHMSSIHLDVGMHCSDCHFSQDSHGNGHLYGEVAAAVEIGCADCHGTSTTLPDLHTSGPAAPEGGTDLSALRTADGRLRFEWQGDTLLQRSALWPDREWAVSLVKQAVDPEHVDYNSTCAQAKQTTGADGTLAHAPEEMACFSCHLSWTTSCAGCHLNAEANEATSSHHYEGEDITRNYATYNPQVVRDQMFQLGRHGSVKDNIIAPVRSSSALVLSVTNANRERIVVQQAPTSSAGFSSQAFAPHFPHTVRKTETKQCDDCHVSDRDDNNAIMAQLLLQGTDFVNFLGLHAWVGGAAGITAVEVTEWSEPQAVIGSYLHRYAYPDDFASHEGVDQELQIAKPRGTRGAVGCLQLRGEYLYAAISDGHGLQAYDVAAIGHKGVSQPIRTGSSSPLGERLRVPSPDARCVALPTNQPIRPDWNRREIIQTENQEQAMHPVYSYAALADAQDGLVLVDVETLANGEPRDNKLSAALRWDADGRLGGARHLVFAGHIVYVTTERGVAVVDLDQPLSPRLLAEVPLTGARAADIQFRYLFVAADDGLHVVDVTHPDRPVPVPEAIVPLAQAHRVFISRTYAYVAAGTDGLAIIDVERPREPRLVQRFTADGALQDVRDVVVASTNASLFAYVADAAGALHVVQLTAPDRQPKFYGFSPAPRPERVAWSSTNSAALSLSRGLERDRAVDETGNQIAILGRLGSRPFTRSEMERLYLDAHGELWTVPSRQALTAP